MTFSWQIVQMAVALIYSKPLRQCAWIWVSLYVKKKITGPVKRIRYLGLEIYARIKPFEFLKISYPKEKKCSSLSFT